jgi:predicted metalloprotease
MNGAVAAGCHDRIIALVLCGTDPFRHMVRRWYDLHMRLDAAFRGALRKDRNAFRLRVAVDRFSLKENGSPAPGSE